MWRRKVLKYLPKDKNLHILDLATGTADLLLLLGKQPNIKEAIGIDLSKEMLKIGQIKIDKKKLNDKCKLFVEDIEKLSFKNNTFDFVSIAFGIRNVPDTLKGCQEMFRVLKKNGIMVVLELTSPSNLLLRFIYLTYFRFILPFIGSKISGDKEAYSYLNKTVEAFPQGEDFCIILKEAGFKNIDYKCLTGGIATLYIGYKL